MAKIFAIADLHLSFGEYVDFTRLNEAPVLKPMDVFGENWKDHYLKIYENWLRVVSEEDFVLLPGDISWALKLEDAKYDLDFIEKMPGKKILGKGNHDYWWQSQKKILDMISDNISILYNNSFLLRDDLALCGTRGWVCPNDIFFSEHDEKLYKRELIRLENSLSKAPKDKNILVMLHFPPVNINHEKNEFIELMELYSVKTCIYGHLHDNAILTKIEGEKWGISFHLVSSDYLDFKPKLLFK